MAGNQIKSIDQKLCSINQAKNILRSVKRAKFESFDDRAEQMYRAKISSLKSIHAFADGLEFILKKVNNEISRGRFDVICRNSNDKCDKNTMSSRIKDEYRKFKAQFTDLHNIWEDEMLVLKLKRAIKIVEEVLY